MHCIIFMHVHQTCCRYTTADAAIVEIVFSSALVFVVLCCHPACRQLHTGGGECFDMFYPCALCPEGTVEYSAGHGISSSTESN